MPQRDEGKSQGETNEDNNQRNPADQAISAMAATGTPADLDFESPCIRCIRQLLPAFDSRVLRARTIPTAWTQFECRC